MKVSVIIPVYNAATFLDKSIQSALDQAQTAEVIVIDDRSTDGSWEKCVEWVEKDSRVKLYKNEGTKGAGAARNVGLRNARYEYIAFLDADDYYLDGRFDETEKLFHKMPEIDGVAESAIVAFNHSKDSKVISGSFSKEELLGYKINNKKITPLIYLKESNLLITGLTIKKQVINNTLQFDKTLKQTQDTDFMIFLFQNYNIYSGNYNNPIVVYHFHENNTTKNFYEAAYYRYLFYRKHLRLCLKCYYPADLVFYFFKRYIEYTYVIKSPNVIISKKITKVILMPVFIYNILSKSVIPFDKDQTIHQI